MKIEEHVGKIVSLILQEDGTTTATLVFESANILHLGLCEVSQKHECTCACSNVDIKEQSNTVEKATVCDIRLIKDEFNKIMLEYVTECNRLGMKHDFVGISVAYSMSYQTTYSTLSTICKKNGISKKMRLRGDALKFNDFLMYKREKENSESNKELKVESATEEVGQEEEGKVVVAERVVDTLDSLDKLRASGSVIDCPFLNQYGSYKFEELVRYAHFNKERITYGDALRGLQRKDGSKKWNTLEWNKLCDWFVEEWTVLQDALCLKQCKISTPIAYAGNKCIEFDRTAEVFCSDRDRMFKDKPTFKAKKRCFYCNKDFFTDDEKKARRAGHNICALCFKKHTNEKPKYSELVASEGPFLEGGEEHVERADNND